MVREREYVHKRRGHEIKKNRHEIERIRRKAERTRGHGRISVWGGSDFLKSSDCKKRWGKIMEAFS